VQGVFAQCEECGHGGHQGHLEEWFDNFGICTFPGCEHICAPAKPDPDYKFRRTIVDISSDDELTESSSEEDDFAVEDEDDEAERVSDREDEEDGITTLGNVVDDETTDAAFDNTPPRKVSDVTRKFSTSSEKVLVGSSGSKRDLIQKPTRRANGASEEERSPADLEDTDDDSIVVIAKNGDLYEEETDGVECDLDNVIVPDVPLTFRFEDVHGNPYYRASDGSLKPVRDKKEKNYSREVKVFYPVRSRIR